MAHIHLPEGSLPLIWALVWWAACVLAIAGAVYYIRNIKAVPGQALTLTGLCTAAAFAIFQIEVPIFGGVHLNLTPLIGILIGPGFGTIVSFIVNIFSAAIGHGGWGLIGANTLINISEITAGYYLYMALGKGSFNTFWRAATAALVALLIGNIVMVTLVVVSGIQGVEQSRIAILYGLAIVVGINMAVAVIESVMTGFMVSYIRKVRPDILAR